MKEVYLKIVFNSSRLKGLILPAEIRDIELGRIAWTTLPGSISLSPGDYYVSIKLPSGQSLHSRFTVTLNTETTVALQLAPADEVLSAEEEIQKYFWSPIARNASFNQTSIWYETAESPSASFALRAFDDVIVEAPFRTKQNYFLTKCVAGEPRSWIEFQVIGTRCLQILTEGGMPVNVVLPTLPDESCRLIGQKSPGKNMMFDVHPSHVVTDALYCYLRNGHLSQAEALATLMKESHDELRNQPLLAVLVGYTLLQLSELGSYVEIIEDISSANLSLVDPFIILADHYARSGEHELAVHQLMKVADIKRLPTFAEGLSYCLERFDYYLGKAGDGILSRQDALTISELRLVFQRLASYSISRRGVLCWTGLNPSIPDKARIPTGVDVRLGLEAFKLLKVSEKVGSYTSLKDSSWKQAEETVGQEDSRYWRSDDNYA